MKKLFIFIITLVSTLTFAGTTPRGTYIDFIEKLGYTDAEIDSEMVDYYERVYALNWTCNSICIGESLGRCD